MPPRRLKQQPKGLNVGKLLKDIGREQDVNAIARIAAMEQNCNLPVYRTTESAQKTAYKSMATNFPQHATSLRTLFGHPDTRLRGAACVLVARVGMDIALGRKLKDEGFYDLIGRQLSEEKTRTAALAALRDLLGGAGRTSIEMLSDTLAQSCGTQLLEVGMSTGLDLSSLCDVAQLLGVAACSTDHLRDRAREVLDFFMHCVNQPTPDRYLRNKIMENFRTLVGRFDYGRHVIAHEETVIFLVGTLRHPNLCWRSTSLGILAASQETLDEPPPPPPSTNFSPVYSDPTTPWAIWASRTNYMVECALKEVRRDRDVVKLGVRLAELVELDPTLCFALHALEQPHVMEGVSAPSSKSCIVDENAFGWIQQAIVAHEKLVPSGHVSTLLNMKCMAGAKHYEQIRDLGIRHVAAHGPSKSAALHYFMSGAQDECGGFREVHEHLEEGLNANPSPFAKTLLLQSFLFFSYRDGMRAISGRETPGVRYQAESAAYVRRAYDAVDTFLKCTPYDFIYLADIHHVLVFLQLIFHGPQLSISLKELQPMIKLERKARRHWLGEPDSHYRDGNLIAFNSACSTVNKLIMKHYAEAASRWDKVYAVDAEPGLEMPPKGVAIPHAASKDSCCGDCGADLGTVSSSKQPRSCGGGTVTLDLCAGCFATGSKLRTCSRCRAAKYCSAECQTFHWRWHKAVCEKV